MRAELSSIVDALHAAHRARGQVTLDAIGEAIGTRAITSEEIDAIMRALEEKGLTIQTPAGGDGETLLKAVVAAARALNGELGRKPTLAELAERSGLSTAAVRHALSLLQIMQR